MHSHQLLQSNLNQLMLGFSTHNKQSNPNFKELNFEPMVIINKLTKEVSPRKQQKIILKANKDMSKERIKSKNNHHHDSIDKNKSINNTKWVNTQKAIGTFDKKLKKNELAQEERRLKNQIKKQKQLIHQEIVINEKNIKGKNLSMQAEKDQEIQYLKKMIQIERTEKIKNDKLYEQKKQQIQRERQQLIQLEKRIQKEGVKSKVVKEIRNIVEEKPVQQKSYKIDEQYKGSGNKANKISYQQPTQSQVLHQKNRLREEQLAYLIDQRQKRVNNSANINYSPTLIPLLSKASYKIISTHVSSLVQLLIDDLLQEQVYLLQKIQLQQRKTKEVQKQRQILNDYYNQLDQFVSQNDEIANRIGKYSTMNFTDIYKPKHYPASEKNNYETSKNKLKSRLNLQFDDDQMEQIQNRKDKFIRFVSNFDEYKKGNIKMFEDVTEQLIQQAIMKLARQLDKGSGQFVDIVFRNQFN